MSETVPRESVHHRFDFAPGPTALRSLVNSALHMREYETRLYFEYYDTSPRLVGRPESPPELRVSPGAPADTVLFEALIGKDGRVRQLRLVRGDARLADLAAPLVNRYEYKPALSRTRPVAAQIHIRVPVPEEAR